MLEKILKLGNPKLYEISEEVSQNEVSTLLPQMEELHQLVLEFRKTMVQAELSLHHKLD